MSPGASSCCLVTDSRHPFATGAEGDAEAVKMSRKDRKESSKVEFASLCVKNFTVIIDLNWEEHHTEKVPTTCSLFFTFLSFVFRPRRLLLLSSLPSSLTSFLIVPNIQIIPDVPDAGLEVLEAAGHVLLRLQQETYTPRADPPHRAGTVTQRAAGGSEPCGQLGGDEDVPRGI